MDYLQAFMAQANWAAVILAMFILLCVCGTVITTTVLKVKKSERLRQQLFSQPLPPEQPVTLISLQPIARQDEPAGSLRRQATLRFPDGTVRTIRVAATAGDTPTKPGDTVMARPYRREATGQACWTFTYVPEPTAQSSQLATASETLQPVTVKG